MGEYFFNQEFQRIEYKVMCNGYNEYHYRDNNKDMVRREYYNDSELHDFIYEE